MEKFLANLLTREIRELELKLVSIEVKLSSIESRLTDLHEEMRKILERPEKRRWLI
ncbi:MAG: hypothetical protein J7J94_03525 [Thaumarchaeota archaeon]|nr:hypothetical protein [Nitrososphaerota archaeon]